MNEVTTQEEKEFMSLRIQEFLMAFNGKRKETVIISIITALSLVLGEVTPEQKKEIKAEIIKLIEGI